MRGNTVAGAPAAVDRSPWTAMMPPGASPLSFPVPPRHLPVLSTLAMAPSDTDATLPSKADPSAAAPPSQVGPSPRHTTRPGKRDGADSQTMEGPSRHERTPRAPCKTPSRRSCASSRITLQTRNFRGLNEDSLQACIHSMRKYNLIYLPVAVRKHGSLARLQGAS